MHESCCCLLLLLKRNITKLSWRCGEILPSTPHTGVQFSVHMYVVCVCVRVCIVCTCKHSRVSRTIDTNYLALLRRIVLKNMKDTFEKSI